VNKVVIYPRLIMPRLIEALADSPVVLLHGPRQCGKTTLARMVSEAEGYAYFSFDDDVTLAAAQADPVGFIGDLPERTVLDEVQRAPDLFTSIKTAVDRNRIPGRFILTGSANVLLVPKLSDSLAGRMDVLRLHPLAQAEMTGRSSGFFATMMAGQFKISSHERLGESMAQRIAAGGYPAALARLSPRRQSAWYRDYIDTMVQRDVQDLARIRSLDMLPRLLMLAAGQSAHLLNVSDLSAPFQVSRQTIRDYITLLTRVFLLEELAPWHSNRLRRLVKSPKLHVCDTGLACALLGVDVKSLMGDRQLLGQLLETFVFQELRRQASWQEEVVKFYHFRSKDGLEVDIVIESEGRRIAGIEVKAAASVTAADFRGLRKLKEVTGECFAAGVLLYDGEATLPFGEKLFAVPIRSLWEI